MKKTLIVLATLFSIWTLAMIPSSITESSSSTMNTFEVLSQMFAEGKVPDPKAWQERLWPGECFFKQSLNGVNYIRPAAAVYAMRRVKQRPLFSGEDEQYEVFVPFSPLVSLEQFHRQSYEQVVLGGNHIPYSAILEEDSIEIFPAQLPEGNKSAGGHLRVSKNSFLILIMGDEQDPGLICYYYRPSALGKGQNMIPEPEMQI